MTYWAKISAIAVVLGLIFTIGSQRPIIDAQLKCSDEISGTEGSLDISVINRGNTDSSLITLVSAKNIIRFISVSDGSIVNNTVTTYIKYPKNMPIPHIIGIRFLINNSATNFTIERPNINKPIGDKSLSDIINFAFGEINQYSPIECHYEKERDIYGREIYKRK